MKNKQRAKRAKKSEVSEWDAWVGEVVMMARIGRRHREEIAGHRYVEAVERERDYERKRWSTRGKA